MDLLNDIEEDLKRARLEKLWKTLAPWLIGGSVAIVLATIIGVAWNHHQEGKHQEQTALLLKDTAQSLQAAAGKSGTTAALANLRLGDEAMKAEKRDEAAALYAKAAQQAEDAEIKELAKLRAAYAGGNVTLSPQKAAPFAASQYEMLGWQAFTAGKHDEAKQHFAAIDAIEDAPPTMKTRMKGISWNDAQ